MRSRSWLCRGLFIGLAPLLACAQGSGDSSSSGSYTGIGSSTTTTTSSGTDDGEDTSGTDGGESSDSGPLLDVAGGETGTDGGTPVTGCAKVDILFIVDNSASMNTYQQALADNFGNFIDTLWNVLPPMTDIHVGITTTDFGGLGCINATEATQNCQSTASATEITMHYDTPINAPNEINGSQGRLFTYAGQNYFATTTDQANDDLKTWFSGAATDAGENGCTFEMPMAAAGWAFREPNLSGPNEGFLRNEEALLVLFFLTDEPDKSPEGVATHRDNLLAAKAGCGQGEPDDICIVTAGFIPPCTANNTPQQNLYKFMAAFGEDEVPWGDVTATTDYSMLVGDVLAGAIASACEEIPPVE